MLRKIDCSKIAQEWGPGALAGAAAAVIILLIGFFAPGAQSAMGGKTPVELGDVDWERDFERARARAEAASKPLFVLFQEIPGCQTCVSFGEQVLSHPLLVEAIETEFVPVAVYNNRPGADRKTLERFREPAWNNPVVRFLSAETRDLLPRQSGIYRPGEMAERMNRALAAAGRPAPAYLKALAQELEPAGIQKATFSMPCYWVGEACLGALPGLLSSRTGDLGGREVVELRFDSTRTSYLDILRKAKALGCADGVFAHGPDQLRSARLVFGDSASEARGFAKDATRRNQKFHLKKASRKIARLDLTPAQSTQLNHALWAGRPWKHLLSGRQLEAIGGAK